MWGLILRLLTAGGIVGGAAAGAGAGTAAIAAAVFPKVAAGGIEILAGLLDAIGYIFLLAFMLGWRKGGERIAIIWPLSIILEVVAHGLWNS